MTLNRVESATKLQPTLYGEDWMTSWPLLAVLTNIWPVCYL